MNEKKYIQYIFISLFPILTLIKLMSIYGIPFYINARAWCDDRLYVHYACNILSGGWLGGYNESTLVKGPFYALYLAALHRLHLPYFMVTTFLFCLSCLAVVLAVQTLIKNKWLLLAAYCILIFNPVMTSADSFQHIYRCVLSPMEVNFLFAGYLGMYCSREKRFRCQSVWCACACIGLSSLFFTREDSIWVFPFVAVATVIMIILCMVRYKGQKKGMLCGMILILTPALVLIMNIMILKGINYRYYGVAVTTEVSEGSFPKAIKMLYSVEDPNEIERVSVSREKMSHIYQYSETLNSIRPIMENDLDGWSMSMGDDGNREVTDAHLYWAVRSAAGKAGVYSDSQHAECFYASIAEELREAVEDGKLNARGVMPSALMSPWRKGYFTKLMETERSFWRQLYGFACMQASVTESIDDGEGGLAVVERLIRCDSVNSVSDDMKVRRMDRAVKNVNGIWRLYALVNPLLFLLSMVLFIFLTGKILLKKEKDLTLWVCALSVLLTIFVLSLGISYTHISAYMALLPSYMAGGYPLLMLFEVLMVVNIRSIIRVKVK